MLDPWTAALFDTCGHASSYEFTLKVQATVEKMHSCVTGVERLHADIRREVFNRVQCKKAAPMGVNTLWIGKRILRGRIVPFSRDLPHKQVFAAASRAKSKAASAYIQSNYMWCEFDFNDQGVMCG